MSEILERRRPGRPLEGVRIIECAVWHAGPGADAILGDLGAEVIKIESLGGDSERAVRTFGSVPKARFSSGDWSLLYEISNRNKKGICLDVATSEGLEILHRLVERADIFTTNLRTDTKLKLGIDYAALSKVNPKLIHVNVSAFGPKGPLADVGGFDPMGQAVSGMLFVTGSDEPVVLQSMLLDQMCAITASHAMLTALVARHRDGIGQEIHTSLFGSAIWLMYANFMMTSAAGEDVRKPWGRNGTNMPLTMLYKCRDGKWILGTHSPESKYWSRFCQAVGLNELDTTEFASDKVRQQHREFLIEKIEVVFARRDRVYWLDLLKEAGLNFAPVQRISEALSDPQALLNDYVVEVDHAELGTIGVPGHPIKFSAYEAGPSVSAPSLGQHTEEVLAAAGYDKGDIDALRASNIVR
jgi:crotonobetainyl-CoA:carnitine CoA-transferase CaiB-like acyl-CoA transferase